nr:RNA-splicing factor [Polyrhizophydium stewartii]
MSALRPRQAGPNPHAASAAAAPALQHRQPNKAILAHERKRQVEVRCLELEDSLLAQGVDEQDVAERVQALRTSLNAELERADQLAASSAAAAAAAARDLHSHQVHQLAEAKAHDNRRFASALKIDSDFVEGGSFDKERLERKRLERIADRERRQRERELIEKARSAAARDKRGAKKRSRRRDSSSSSSGSESSSSSDSDSGTCSVEPSSLSVAAQEQQIPARKSQIAAAAHPCPPAIALAVQIPLAV